MTKWIRRTILGLTIALCTGCILLAALYYAIRRNACSDEVLQSVSLSGVTLEVEGSGCDLLAKDYAVNVYAMRDLQSRPWPFSRWGRHRKLIFRYDPGRDDDPLPSISRLSHFPVEDHNMHTWGFTVIYIGAGFLVAKAIAFEGPRPIRLMSKLLASVGLYSYSIYIWHMFYQSALAYFHITSFPLWCACYLLGAILFGLVAAKAVEFPVLRFRDRVFPSISKINLASNKVPPTDELAVN